MEVDNAAAFASGEYVEDVELARIVPTLDDAAGFAPGDFIDDNHLPIVLGLMSETSLREAEKAEEWLLVTTSEAVAASPSASPPRQRAPVSIRSRILVRSLLWRRIYVKLYANSSRFVCTHCCRIECMFCLPRHSFLNF
jgi:hypothetical protein